MKVQYQTMAELARDTLLIGAKEKSPQVMSIIQNIESHHFSVRGKFLDKHYMIPSAHCIQFFSKDKKNLCPHNRIRIHNSLPLIRTRTEITN